MADLLTPPPSPSPPPAGHGELRSAAPVLDAHPLDAVRALASSQDGVVLRSQAEAHGLLPSTWRGQLRAAWPPLLRGAAFVPDAGPGLPAVPGVRARARAALLSTDPDGVLGHGSVLRLAGVEGTPLDDVEHVHTTGPCRHQRAGVRLHWARVDEQLVVDREGLRCVPVWRALRDALRGYDREHAVSVLDSAAHRGLVPSAGLPFLARLLPAERAGWLRLVDDRAESPLETRVHLLAHDRQLGPLELQVWVVLPGYGPARLDGLIAGCVVLEADGREAHDGPASAYRDRRRHEALEAAGFVVVRLTWADVVHHPDETVRRLLAALARARPSDVRVETRPTQRRVRPYTG